MARRRWGSGTDRGVVEQRRKADRGIRSQRRITPGVCLSNAPAPGAPFSHARARRCAAARRARATAVADVFMLPHPHAVPVDHAPSAVPVRSTTFEIRAVLIELAPRVAVVQRGTRLSPWPTWAPWRCKLKSVRPVLKVPGFSSSNLNTRLSSFAFNLNLHRPTSGSSYVVDSCGSSGGRLCVIGVASGLEVYKPDRFRSMFMSQEARRVSERPTSTQYVDEQSGYYCMKKRKIDVQIVIHIPLVRAYYAIQTAFR